MTTHLVRYNEAMRAVAECSRVDEVKEIRDKAEAMAAYARQAKDTEMLGWVTEIKVRAEWRCGEMLRESAEAGRRATKAGNVNPSNKVSHDSTPSLRDIGITRDESSRYQKIAAMPSDYFEAAIAIAKEREGQVTTAFMLREAKKLIEKPTVVDASEVATKRSGQTHAERLEEIREMANAGHIPEQIAQAVGVSVDYMRRILSKEGIKVSVQKRGRGIDPNKVVRESVSALSGIAHGLSMAKHLEIDASEAKDLLADLRVAMKAIRSLEVTLKEISNVE